MLTGYGPGIINNHSESLNQICYEMEVGENRVRVFNGTERREGERVEIYTGGISLCTSDYILDLKYVSGTYISVILSNCTTLESVVMELLLFYFYV